MVSQTRRNSSHSSIRSGKRWEGSRWAIARRIAASRRGSASCRGTYSGLVATDRCMATADRTAFSGASRTPQTRSTSWGQWRRGYRGTATQSDPSALRPARHSTKPPKTDRLALPEPSRASCESSGGLKRRPAARDAAPASAANPLALLASPLAVGKLFRLRISARSESPARSRTRSRKRRADSRGPPTATRPLRTSRSSDRPVPNRTVVTVCIRSSVNEREEL